MTTKRIKSNSRCPKCGRILKKETDKYLKKTYPWVCNHCDENFFNFESIFLSSGKMKNQGNIEMMIVDLLHKYKESMKSWGKAGKFDPMDGDEVESFAKFVQIVADYNEGNLSDDEFIEMMSEWKKENK